MYYRKVFILLIVFSLLLSISACSSNQNGTELPPQEQPEEINPDQPVTNSTASDDQKADSPPLIEVLEPPELPEKINPKLGSGLNGLILAERRGEAEAFARPRNIELLDGSVWVIIKCVPGQVEAAAKAASNAGSNQIRMRSGDNLLKALVPITSLEALANEESIRAIQLPVPPTLE